MEKKELRNQRNEWNEISKLLKKLAGKDKNICSDDDVDSFSKSEAPVYLEWSVWRAFLALDELINKPYESRRFNVDQDILPINPAPGSGSNLVMDYAKTKLLVEVTLTENDRQHVAESEPVRRHVAEAANGSLPIYGLFIAKKLNGNVINDFFLEDWYDSADEIHKVKIVPLTIEQFDQLLSTMFKNGEANSEEFLSFVSDCWEKRKESVSPLDWKTKIKGEVDKTIISLGK